MLVNCPTSGRSDSYRLRKGFIRAKLLLTKISFSTVEAKCKEAGKFKVEGKDVVKDGDVMHFRFKR
jgi:ribosome-binding ATPase YchF (GTP1/OBG family)